MVPLPFHKDQSEGFVHACGRVLKRSYYAYILDTAKGHSRRIREIMYAID